MNIRQLLSTDAADFRALRLRALREHPDAFTSSFEEASLRLLAESEQRLASHSTVHFWGAFDSEILVGMVGLDYEQRMKARHKALVVAMYVVPEQGRRGIGGVLLDKLVTQARADGLEALILTVTVGNQGAERLYLNAGFVSFGIEPQAVKVQHQYFGKNHMRLSLVP
jgi:L-amino acid N-acyltransferase YncA